MTRMRLEEHWAASVISATLGGVLVKQHDDGTQPGMYDLAVMYPDRPTAAVEVTTATDPHATALWRLVNPPGARWTDDRLTGGWAVAVRPAARGKRLQQDLPPILLDLERDGIDALGSADWRWPGPIHSGATELGVTHAMRGGTSYPGSIYITIDLPDEQSVGMVAADGDALSAWLTEWVRDPSRSDNLRKLAASGQPERHLVVILRGFSATPFDVQDLLLRDDPPLPTQSLDLPPEITHAWTMSGWSSRHGLRWDPDTGWSKFSKLLAN